MSAQVEKRFSMFKSVDLKNEELSKFNPLLYWDVCHNVFYCGSSPADILLHHFPSLLSSPLSKLVLAKIRAARDIGFGAHWHREKSSLTSHEVSSPPLILLSSSAKPLGGGGGGAICSQAPWPSSAYLCAMGRAKHRAIGQPWLNSVH